MSENALQKLKAMSISFHLLLAQRPEHEHEAACTCLLYANQSSCKSGKFYANFNIGPAMLPSYVAKQFISDYECMKNQ